MRKPTKWSRFDIDVDAYFGRFLLGDGSVDTLQQICQAHAPAWVSRLRIWPAHRSIPQISLSNPAALREAVYADSKHHGKLYDELMRRFGISEGVVSGVSEIRGSDSSITLVLTVSERIHSTGNRFVFQLRRKRIEGIEAASFAARLFEDICARLDPWYARARPCSEFDAKNMIDNGRVTRAIGVNVAKALPGLYWQNYFGAPCVEAIGADRFAATPAFRKERIGDGYLIGLAKEPWEWETVEYRQLEAEVRRSLGEELFFLRENEDRQTRSPLVWPDEPTGPVQKLSVRVEVPEPARKRHTRTRRKDAGGSAAE